MNIRKSDTRISNLQDFDAIEKKFSIKFPDFLKIYLLQHEGASLIDKRYYDHSEVHEILYVYKSENGASIEAILGGHNYYGIKNFIPFAIDSGGWDFNVSIAPETFGQVWVNEFDNGEGETMVFVAPSFEEFINNLGPDPEE